MEVALQQIMETNVPPAQFVPFKAQLRSFSQATGYGLNDLSRVHLIDKILTAIVHFQRDRVPRGDLKQTQTLVLRQS